MSYFSDTAAAFQLRLSAVDGVTAFTDTPDGPSPGDAWARWTAMEPAGPPGLYQTTWEVIVVTGGTPADGRAFLDARLSDILDAIEGFTVVMSVNPATFSTPSGELYGVAITTYRE